MATSGTATFNLDIHEIIEEAYERAGLGRAFSGNDFRTARRSLNLLAQDFSNRGINLWTVEEKTLALTSGTATYNLPADTVSVLDHSIREGTGTSQSDLSISRMSLGEYAGITSKNTTGRPVKIYIERLTEYPKATVWPIPDNNNYTLVYYRIRRIEDSVNGSITQYDAPTRFLPAIISGLAYHLSLKNPDVADRIQLLKGLYEEDFALAATEDRDRSDFRIVPAL
tara:strand:- start:1163 stop:1840 length:678 start_codon:yes stop_codon:yes gene_type:complete